MVVQDHFISVLQVPSSSTTGGQAGAFLSVIDASGSMSSFWPSVAKIYNDYFPKTENSYTVTFDGKARYCQSNYLQSNIRQHGGGLTNIPNAFALLDQKLQELDVAIPATVLFISDGQDNNLTTLPARLNRLKGHRGRKITFLCLGIQSKFPTFLSMKLRDLYHNSLSSIPALFLIEFFTEAALRNKFEAMKEYFYHRCKVQVSPPIREFPWSFDVSDSLYEGTWLVLTSEDLPGARLTLGHEEYDLRQHPPTIDLVLALFRSFVQEMQMLSLLKSDCLVEQAGQALQVMQELVDFFQQKHGIDLLKPFKLIGQMEQEEVHEEVEQMMKLGFLQRVEYNKLRHNQFRIQGYFENIDMLARGLGVQQLNEWEAAKRIGIGTITGNYYQKALNLNGLTVSQFQIIRNEFLDVYRSCHLSEQDSKQEQSIVTLLNQKEIFVDAEFVKGLSACTNQFDLVETFPVVGLALNVKRPQRVDVNPWLIQVRSIAKHNRQLDSLSLLKSDFKISFSTGTDSEREFVNAVLPLFSLQDADMQPLLSHDLFALLMTFVVQRNVDMLDRMAYLALLCNAAVFLLREAQSTYKTDMLESILETTKLVYGSKSTFVNYNQLLLSKPEKVILTEDVHELCRAVASLLYLNHFGYLSSSDKYMLTALAYVSFFRIVTGGRWTAALHVSNAFLESISETILDQFKKKMHTFQTLGAATRWFEGQVQTISISQAQLRESDLCISVKAKCGDKEGDKLSLLTLSFLYEHLLGQAPSEHDLLFFLFVSSLQPQKLSNPEEIVDAIVTHTATNVHQRLIEKLIETKSDLFSLYQGTWLQEAKDVFLAKFREDHDLVVPLSEVDIIKKCKERSIDPSTLLYDDSINMVRNACMAPNCPFFLVATPNLSKHLDTWQRKCPRAFHKTVKKHLSSSSKAILDKLLLGDAQRFPKLRQDLNEFYPADESHALKYISMVKQAYKKIQRAPKPKTSPVPRFEYGRSGRQGHHKQTKNTNTSTKATA